MNNLQQEIKMALGETAQELTAPAPKREYPYPASRATVWRAGTVRIFIPMGAELRNIPRIGRPYVTFLMKGAKGRPIKVCLYVKGDDLTKLVPLCGKSIVAKLALEKRAWGDGRTDFVVNLEKVDDAEPSHVMTVYRGENPNAVQIRGFRVRMPGTNGMIHLYKRPEEAKAA